MRQRAIWSSIVLCASALGCAGKTFVRVDPPLAAQGVSIALTQEECGLDQDPMLPDTFVLDLSLTMRVTNSATEVVRISPRTLAADHRRARDHVRRPRRGDRHQRRRQEGPARPLPDQGARHRVQRRDEPGARQGDGPGTEAAASVPDIVSAQQHARYVTGGARYGAVQVIPLNETTLVSSVASDVRSSECITGCRNVADSDELE